MQRKENIYTLEAHSTTWKILISQTLFAKNSFSFCAFPWYWTIFALTLKKSYSFALFRSFYIQLLFQTVCNRVTRRGRILKMEISSEFFCLPACSEYKALRQNMKLKTHFWNQGIKMSASQAKQTVLLKLFQLNRKVWQDMAPLTSPILFLADL